MDGVVEVVDVEELGVEDGKRREERPPVLLLLLTRRAASPYRPFAKTSLFQLPLAGFSGQGQAAPMAVWDSLCCLFFFPERVRSWSSSEVEAAHVSLFRGRIVESLLSLLPFSNFSRFKLLQPYQATMSTVGQVGPISPRRRCRAHPHLPLQVITCQAGTPLSGPTS